VRKSCLRQVSAKRSGQFTAGCAGRRRHHAASHRCRSHGASGCRYGSLSRWFWDHLIAGSRTHILSGGMSSLVGPDHCLGDLPTCTGLESIPPAEDYFPEGSIVSKSSATPLFPHPNRAWKQPGLSGKFRAGVSVRGSLALRLR
jgi:hypothetical protein